MNIILYGKRGYAEVMAFLKMRRWSQIIWVGPNVITRVFRRGKPGRSDYRRGEGNRSTGVEGRAMQPQAKEC